MIDLNARQARSWTISVSPDSFIPVKEKVATAEAAASPAGKKRAVG